MITPAVTILMPAYNAGKYIGEAISSVLGQTFTDFELVIVDDGSTDNTVDVIKSFDDKRIVWISQENQGISGALNTGLRLAKGRYIARFDADDICYPQRITVQFNFLEANTDYILVGSDVEYITQERELIYRHHCFAYSNTELQEKLFFYCPFIHSSVMYKKEFVLKAGGYHLSAITFEDHFLWVKIMSLGKVANLPLPLIQVRLTPGSIAMDDKWTGRRFRKLRRTIITRGSITADEEKELRYIVDSWQAYSIKHGSYYALCAKKFLADNFMPKKAREYAVKAIQVRPSRMDNYAILLACFLPEALIRWLHAKSPNRL